MFRLALIALLIPASVSAQGMDDAARARAAVNRGEILRLSKVLPRIEQQFGGLVLDTALLTRNGSYTYAFDLLTRDARLIEVLVDASTGELLSVAPGMQGGDQPRPVGRRGGGDRNDGDRDDDDDDDDDGGHDDDDGGGGGGDDDDHGGDDDGGDDDGGDGNGGGDDD